MTDDALKKDILNAVKTMMAVIHNARINDNTRLTTVLMVFTFLLFFRTLPDSVFFSNYSHLYSSDITGPAIFSAHT